MRKRPFHTRLRRRQAGFTLIEISIAMAIMLILGVTLILMLQGHVRFLEMFRQQAFLSAEAPKIGNLLGRIMNQADHFFVYATTDDAMAETDPILTPGTAVRLFFKSPDQVTTSGVIAVVNDAGDYSLRYYSQPPDDTQFWDISTRIEGANFLSDQGILSITLLGPSGEVITYHGSAR